LTAEAGGLGAVFTQEGQISAKDRRSRMRRYATGRLDFGRFDQEIVFSACDGKFWRGSPHRRYQQLFSLKFESIGFLFGAFNRGDSLGTE
jgi:hypothetical protein